jgi:heme/copper-type cytochrome/quinol oxidase subunit 2
MNIFDTKFLFASLLWGSIGVGYFIYGKKQRELMPMLGGVAMVAVSYLVNSALLMSLISIVLMVTVYLLMKRGW